ncbi:NADP-dependent oxidoreductase [Mycetocola spongiae]|nr:NADP-dependent oxidoreductase [Mycetocola spongiae]
MPEKMVAAVYDAVGPAENMYLTEITPPLPMTADVMVRVDYSALNPIDVKTRAGGGASPGVLNYPAVIGSDFAGVVVAAPYAAHPLQPGTPVYGMNPVPRYPGTYAEYTAVPSMSLSRMPTTIGADIAAAVPLAGMTAWGMVELAEVAAGQRVLVHAGAGGVGHFAVQFAALRGAHVIATGSARNREFLLSLGAAEVIDYRSERFEEVLRPVDVVIDLIGNVHDNTGTRSLQILRPGGYLVNAPSFSWPTMAEEAEAAGVRASLYKVSPDARVLDQITALIDAGKLTVHVDALYDLADIVQAHNALEQGHTRGKIVLRIPHD